MSGRPFHSRFQTGFKYAVTQRGGRGIGSVAGRGNNKSNSPGWFNEMAGRPLAGRRTPGQLGGCDTPYWGRKILRMNTKYQLIYILGTVGGEVGTWGRIYDTRTTKNDLGTLEINCEMYRNCRIFCRSFF